MSTWDYRSIKTCDFAKAFYLIAAALCLFWPFITSGTALAIGLFFGIVWSNPFVVRTKALTHRFLSVSIIGLGAGMNLIKVAQVGSSGIIYTMIGICFALGLGWLLGRRLGVNDNTSILISVGTAICGGSAIASVSPVLRAKSHEISIALGIVFLLNSFALFVFPHVGHWLALTQEQFGLWCALAIHDTSSVVGATLVYGDQALEVGTTVKLARALWIVPITLLLGFTIAKFRKADEEGAAEIRKKYPWFILGFLMMAALFTWVPALSEPMHYIEFAAKRLLILTLFLIGSNLNKEILRGMGFRPVFQGVLLWLIIASGSLIAISSGWIHL